MKRLLLILTLLAAGCGGPGEQKPPASVQKQITWQEFQQMPLELRIDPSILDRLDDDARQKLAGSKSPTKP